jgi:hypothetical protein
MICHQSLAAVRPTICAVSPLLSVPICCAEADGAARMRKFSLAVASTGPAPPGTIGNNVGAGLVGTKVLPGLTGVLVRVARGAAEGSGVGKM